MSLSGCLHRLDQRVEALPDLAHDRGYANVYRHATRHSRVYRGFEHQFSVGATHLSPTFLQAFRTRHSLLVDGREDMLVGDASKQQTAFLISLATPSAADLRDYTIWTVRLYNGSSSLDPVVIKKIRNKDKLELFFRNITPWSSEYLLVFESGQHAVPHDPLQLVLGNARARVRLSWNDY